MTYAERLDFVAIGQAADLEIANLTTERDVAQLESANLSSAIADLQARLRLATDQATADQRLIDTLRAKNEADGVLIVSLRQQIADLTAAPPMPAQPGPDQGFTRYQDIVGTGRFTTKLAGLADGSKVSFPEGIIETSNFLDGGNPAPYGFMVTKQSELVGAGVDKTVFRVTPGSSAKAGWYTDVRRSTAYKVGDTRCSNQSGWVLRCTTAGTTGATIPQAFLNNVNNALPAGSLPATVQDGTVVWTTISNVNPTYVFAVPVGTQLKVIRDLTIAGSELGHIFNGIRWDNNELGLLVQRIKVVGIPGTSPGNPGETFGPNINRCGFVTFEDVEVDGRDAAGVLVAASGLGINNSHDIKMVRGDYHHTKVGNAIAAWQTTNMRYEGTIARDAARVGFAHERVHGTVVLDRVEAYRCTLGHAQFNNDQSSALVTINDPKFDGPKFRVRVSSGYLNGQMQRKEDIKLFMGGVERPDLLAFV